MRLLGLTWSVVAAGAALGQDRREYWRGCLLLAAGLHLALVAACYATRRWGRCVFNLGGVADSVADPIPAC